MYISPNDITAFEEQDIETVLADELADSEDRSDSRNVYSVPLMRDFCFIGSTPIVYGYSK